MKLLSKNESETIQIGQRLGARLRAGHVVCLYGELGAGKTTMIKGIAKAFGIRERDITSASFTIIAEHDAEVPFYHIDLYRTEPAEIPELGLREYLWTDGVSVIEWAEKAADELTDDTITVRIDHVGDHDRMIDIEGIDL